MMSFKCRCESTHTSLTFTSSRSKARCPLGRLDSTTAFCNLQTKDDGWWRPPTPKPEEQRVKGWWERRKVCCFSLFLSFSFLSIFVYFVFLMQLQRLKFVSGTDTHTRKSYSHATAKSEDVMGSCTYPQLRVPFEKSTTRWEEEEWEWRRPPPRKKSGNKIDGTTEEEGRPIKQHSHDPSRLLLFSFAAGFLISSKSNEYSPRGTFISSISLRKQKQ